MAAIISHMIANTIAKRKSPLMSLWCLISGSPLTVPPKKVKNGDETTYDWWASAASQKVLGNPQIIDKLASFDPDNLDVDMMGKIKDVMDAAGDLNETTIGKSCKAARGIFRWLAALTGYYYVYEENKPRRDALLLAQVQIQAKEKLITEKQAELASLQHELDSLRGEYDKKAGEVNGLEDDIEDCKQKSARAVKLLNSLKSEK